MPSCDLIIVAASSAVDRDTNNLSLFNVLEELTVPAASLPPHPTPPIAPYEVHSLWTIEPGLIGQTLHTRHVLFAGDQAIMAGHEGDWTANTLRVRVRAMGLPVPRASGLHTIGAEWRTPTQRDWTPVPLRWPITFWIL